MMRPLSILIAVAAAGAVSAGLACSRERATPAPSAPAEPQPLPPGPHLPAPASTSGPQPGHLRGHHRWPHGGQTAETEAGHVELVATRAGDFTLYLLDRNYSVRAPAGAVAVVQIARPGHQEVVLQQVGDRLEGKGQPIEAEHVEVLLTVHQGATTRTAKMLLHLPAGGEGGAASGVRDRR